jgi:hypothetical protein
MVAERGAREDLSDQLRRVQPSDTPLYSLLPQSAAPAALFTEWNVDDLDQPDITPVVDGTDMQFSLSNPAAVTIPTAGGTDGSGAVGDGNYAFKFANKARLGNRIQSLRKGFTVSPLSEKIEIAGPQSSLYAEAKAKTALEMKRSLEVLIASDENLSTGVLATSGDSMAGLGQFVSPTGDVSARKAYWDAQNSAAAASARAPAGSAPVMNQLDLTAAIAADGTLVEGAPGDDDVSLRGMLQAVYNNAGLSSKFRGFCAPTVVNAITDFSRSTATSTTFNQSASNTGGSSISLSVVSFYSDWGEVSIIPDLFLGRTAAAAGTQNNNRAYFLPTDDTVSLKVMIGLGATDYPDIGGGGPRGQITFTGTLCVLNCRGLGSIV